MENIAKTIIQEIQEQEAIKPPQSNFNELFKPNKNQFVKYMEQQLKAYCLIKKKVQSIFDEIQEIEKYGLTQKSKGILLRQEQGSYHENLSDYERKERVLHYLKEEYGKLYPIYDAYSMRFLIYECYECFDIWRLKEIEGMSEKEIRSLYQILGKECKYTIRQATATLKERIMFEDRQHWNYFGI